MHERHESVDCEPHPGADQTKFPARGPEEGNGSRIRGQETLQAGDSSPPPYGADANPARRVPHAERRSHDASAEASLDGLPADQADQQERESRLWALELYERIDPREWGWGTMTEWLIDYAGLLTDRPSHLGTIRFLRPGDDAGLQIVTEGRSEAPDERARALEYRYRMRVRAAANQLRRRGKL